MVIPELFSVRSVVYGVSIKWMCFELKRILHILVLVPPRKVQEIICHLHLCYTRLRANIISYKMEYSIQPEMIHPARIHEYVFIPCYEKTVAGHPRNPASKGQSNGTSGDMY